jgi:predicted transcriptional regulator
MTETDHELEFLLSLDGHEFRLNSGYVVKIEARTVAATKHRPQGIKYSLTLHDLAGRRIYGMDNAHGVRRQTEYDHRHIYGRRKMVAYVSRPRRFAGGLLPRGGTHFDRERRAMTEKTVKTGTFREFQAFTLAVARGERKVDPNEPKIWMETREGETDAGAETAVRFTSLEAGAKLLSPKNRELLRLIVTREPQSVTELADMAHRAPQNVQRTLHSLSAAGIVRLTRGEGRSIRPVLAARKVHIEIDLGA